jgi:DNA sulfur modification protein DndB
LGQRVHYAQEMQQTEELSKLIQRVLEGARARQIASYLSSTPERFFNSLVLATYKGEPKWLEVGNFQSQREKKIIDQLPDGMADSIGFLQFNGKERIFAIDGQHRLAGIKRALSENVPLEEDLVPIIVVGHKTTTAGMQRTRRLFTTLNKTAVSVKKMDIIALDEDDVMAITARRFVETDPRFTSPKIAVIGNTNLPAKSEGTLTVITNLYDILKRLFLFKID